MRLYIGNKNYSSWSLRPWLLLREAGIPFEEVKLRFDDPSRSPGFRQAALKLSPTARVPVLEDDGLFVWDSLAIAEYAAERFPEKQLWPEDPKKRALARCVCAEMHAGFAALRRAFPMNMELEDPTIGPRVLKEQPATASDLERIDQLLASTWAQSGGPLLFGHFTIADAYFAPVLSRARSYGLPLSSVSARYAQAVWALPALHSWRTEALAEHDFLSDDEPYRERPAAR
ncbi:MAG TPA: glutathione S-transferase family protein [Polyangiales bacterium]|jgi:glutathione S-transferase|nr:glutathione S-transferase family protein [Polyangiales bacterium]